MINNNLITKILKNIYEIDLPQEKILIATNLYIDNRVTIVNNSFTEILFEIDNNIYTIKYENSRVYYFVDKKQIKKDENILACLLTFKRNYYIENELYFDEKDFLMTNYIYRNNFIANYNYNEFKLRYDFYVGLINYIFQKQDYNHSLDLIVNIYNILMSKIYFSEECLNNFEKLKKRYINNFINNISNNINRIKEIFMSYTYSINIFADFLDNVINENPLLLFDESISNIFSELLNHKSQRLQKKYNELLSIYLNVTVNIKKNQNNDCLKMYSHIYSVRYCLVKLLLNTYNYNDIYILFKQYYDVIAIMKKENANYNELLNKTKLEYLRLDNLSKEKLIQINESNIINTFQRFIIYSLENLKGLYNNIPEIVIDIFDKIKLMKNGKYYVYETICFMLNNYELSFDEALIKYCRNLGVVYEDI